MLTVSSLALSLTLRLRTQVLCTRARLRRYISRVSCGRSMRSCRLSMRSCRLSTRSCRLSMRSCRLSMRSCRLSMRSCTRQFSLISSWCGPKQHYVYNMPCSFTLLLIIIIDVSCAYHQLDRSRSPKMHCIHLLVL